MLPDFHTTSPHISSHCIHCQQKWAAMNKYLPNTLGSISVSTDVMPQNSLWLTCFLKWGIIIQKIVIPLTETEWTVMSKLGSNVHCTGPRYGRLHFKFRCLTSTMLNCKDRGVIGLIKYLWLLMLDLYVPYVQYQCLIITSWCACFIKLERMKNKSIMVCDTVHLSFVSNEACLRFFKLCSKLQ